MVNFALVAKALVYLARIVSDIYVLSLTMTGNEFIKRVKKLAKVRGKTVSIDKSRGKGSHLFFGLETLGLTDGRKARLSLVFLHLMW